tara:strand:- start:581 stop:1219 length:639 start_codon:yes stop_codon:yes gene_type:complete
VVNKPLESMIKDTFFQTPIHYEEKPEWVDKLNTVCEPYLNDAKTVLKNVIKKRGTDYGYVYHSNEIASDKKLKFFYDYVGQKSAEFLLDMGYSLKNHSLHFTEMWVQEFPKDGGGAHPQHVHANSHVSGFYFLDTQGSYPMFFDPRTRLEMISLPQQDKTKLTMSSSFISWKIQPGTLILIPAYIMHEYVPQTKQPFKFIHFNVQAIEKRFR